MRQPLRCASEDLWSFYGENGVRGFERNILGFCGISPICETLLGLVETNPRRREAWLQKCDVMSRRGY